MDLMRRYWAPLGKWLVSAGLVVPALAIVSPLVVPGAKEWPLVFGLLWAGALCVSLPLILTGAGLCTAHVVTKKVEATRSDYIFLAIGVNGALLLLVLTAVALVRT